MTQERVPYDTIYKKLFSHPEMVASLVKDFIPEEFIADLDFRTLERCSGSYITDDIRERHDDIVWRVLWKEKWVYIYILLEFQRKPDRWMAVRVLNYITLLWQDLISTEMLKGNDLLPPVFPIVLYNGSKKWTAAVELSDLMLPITGPLAAYQPRQKYFLLEENSISDEELNENKGVASLLMRLERADPHEIVFLIDEILDCLRDHRFDKLREAFKVCILLMFSNKIEMNEVNPDTLDLQEVRAMLAEKIAQWENNYIQQGVLIGEKRGISIGETRGIELVLRDTLETRFGELPQDAVSAIAGVGDAQKLRNLMRRALMVASLEDFLEEVKKC